MPGITTLFWDIGGVILTNGWDRNSRKAACEAFDIDWEEFQDRHDLSFPAFDAGQITINEYLDRTLFYRPRKVFPRRIYRLHIRAIQGVPWLPRHSRRRRANQKIFRRRHQ